MTSESAIGLFLFFVGIVFIGYLFGRFLDIFARDHF